ncbi:MAG TPA: hypothetical protein VLI46_12250 [Ramlibacter sp.]|nr:hypothetical protein [Ramlibacter sp.]
MLLAACLAVANRAYAQDQEEDEKALSSRGVAGEIMDTAVEHCRRGEAAQALSMFGAIRTQLAPPPAILRLIQDLEATGCLRASSAGPSLRLQLGGGWDSNVSQGITARNLVIGSGDNAIELELDESYRPRSSTFAQASLDYSLVVPRQGLQLQAGLGHRRNERESTFDLTTASASAAREFRLHGGSVRAQVEVSEVWLANRHYQSAQGLGLQWLRSDNQGAWLATAGGTRVRYVTQPAQSALQWEAGVLREQRLSAAHSVHAGVTLQRDVATGARPGGDRQGFQLQLGTVLLAYGWRLRPQLSYARWDSGDVFSPGLLDVRRRNRLSQASLHAERPLSERSSLVLEWRGRSARDTVALYRYRAQSFTANLAHRF